MDNPDWQTYAMAGFALIGFGLFMTLAYCAVYKIVLSILSIVDFLNKDG